MRMAPTAGSSRRRGACWSALQNGVKTLYGRPAAVSMASGSASSRPGCSRRRRPSRSSAAGHGLVTSMAEGGDVSGRQDGGGAGLVGQPRHDLLRASASARAGRCRARAARRRARPATAAGTTCVPARPSIRSGAARRGRRAGRPQRAPATAALRAGWSVTRRSRRNQTMAVSDRLLQRCPHAVASVLAVDDLCDRPNIVQMVDTRARLPLSSCYTNPVHRWNEAMTKHTLDSTHIVKADLERVWDFFSRARNLGRITPRSMGFDIHTPDPVTETGAIIDYTVRPLFGIPAHWQTHIDEVEAPLRFRDVQAKGPYRSWVHEHRFTPVDGRRPHGRPRRVRDCPSVRIGALGHRLVVRAAARAHLRLPRHGHRPDLRAGRRPGERATGHHRRRRRDRLRGQRDRP